MSRNEKGKVITSDSKHTRDTVKIHKDIKPESACTKDVQRASILEPYLDICEGKGNIIATDGKIMAVVPVEVGEGDTSGYLSGDALKAARKCAGRCEAATLEANSNVSLPSGVTMPRNGKVDGDYQFPNWRAVMPDEKNGYKFAVAIDARRLWALAQAMGTQGVALLMKSPDEPVIVRPQYCGKHSDAKPPANMDARGVIMPVSAQPTP